MSTQSGASSSMGFDPEHFVPAVHPLTKFYDRGQEESTGQYVVLRSDANEPVFMTEEDLQVWELIDGQRTVSEICRLYLERHRRLALTRVYSLVRRLVVNKIITPPPGNLAKNQPAGSIWERIRLANRIILHVPASGMCTRVLGSVLRKFSPTAYGFHAVLLILALVGAVLSMTGTPTEAASLLLMQRPIETLFGVVQPSVGASIAILLLLNFVASLARETWRGAVESAFHDHPSGLQFVVHYGVPAFQADNRFRAALPLRQRITAAISGIEFELALAGIFTVVIHVIPADSAIVELLTKATWVLYFRTLMHCSPLASADIGHALGTIGDVSRFRNRAISFLRLRLFDVLFGDGELDREQRLYVAWNTIIIGWLLLVFIGAGDLIRAVLQLTGDLNQPGDSGISTMIFLGILVVPALACLLIGGLSILYLFLGWLINSAPFQQPTLSATFSTMIAGTWLGGVLIAHKTGFIGAEGRGMLLYLAALVILLASGALTRKVPRALRGGRQATRLVMGQATVAILAATILTATLAPKALPGLAWVMIVSTSIWIVVSIFTGLSAFSVIGGRLMTTELTALIGALLALVTGLSITGILGVSDTPIALYVGATLFAIGTAASARASTVWPHAAEVRLSVSGPEATRTTIVQEVGSHVISSAATEMRLAFGNGFTNKIAKIDSSTPLNLDAPSEQLGNDARSYGDALTTIGQGVAKQFGNQAAELVMSRAFDAVHWRGRLVLHKEILPHTQWAEYFADENGIGENERTSRLEKILLFQDLKPTQREEIADRLLAKRISPGEALVRQGDTANQCFLIVEGDVQVEEQDPGGQTQILSFLTAGDFFGEAALLEDSVRTATVRAVTSTLVLSWSRTDFLDLAKQSPETAKRLVRQLKYMRVLFRIPLFADLPKQALRNLLPRLQSKQVENRADIIQQGEPGTKFYLIQKGAVEVVKRVNDQDVALCELTDGDYFGEIALLQDQPRSATVRAIAPTQLLVLDKHDFLRLTTASDLFATNLSTVSKDRQKIE